jgi:hypothetical protein
MSGQPTSTGNPPSAPANPDRLAQFPRSPELPPYSPMFWVAQKDRLLRQLLIRDIEAGTGRRFIVYFANRYELGSEIQVGDIARLAEVLVDLGSDPVDILLETGGGNTDATEALISMVQSTVAEFRVIVANAAKSNGTLLALAAQSIVMGAISELGPIEPSINGIPCSVLDTPEVARTNFPLHMTGKYAMQQSKSVATRLLTAGMMAGCQPETITETVEALATRTRFPSHGSVVDHREARALGLNIEYLPPNDEIWRRIWLLYCMYDHDSRRDRLLKVFEGRRLSLAMAAPPGAPLPP